MNGIKTYGIKILAIAAAVGGGAAATSCLEDDVNTILVDPSDPAQGGNSGGHPGGDKPGKPVSHDLRFYMAGLRHPDSGEWPRLTGSGAEQNAWVEIDGESAAAEFVNSDDPGALPFKADIALLVDNSDSMDEENDAIAAGIGTWTAMLAEGGVDARYAVVGHSENGTINGATDFSTAENLEAFFNFMSGQRRTAHFSGPGSDRLEREAGRYPTLNTECCVLALRFGNDQLSFRDDAERVYVSFTDEPNQPYGNAEYSVEWLRGNWGAGMGEAHTVYSAPEPTDYTQLVSEPARSLSDLTGGTVTYTDERLTDFSLTDFAVTEALTHAYTARIADVSRYMDGETHQVTITIRSTDGKVNGTKRIPVIFSKD